MESKEIDRQLSELWKKASGKEYIPEFSASSLRFSESQVETIQFLKNNFSKAESDWKYLLEVKESGIRDLSAQLCETRAQLGELKQCCQEAREKAISEELSAALSLGESGKMLEAQKSRHAREVALLTEVLERTRIEMASLSARLEVFKARSEEWREKFTRSVVEQANLKDAVVVLERKFCAAREASEKTLSELMAERRARAESGKRIKEAEEKAAELQFRLSVAKFNLDAARKGERELCDRKSLPLENRLKTD